MYHTLSKLALTTIFSLSVGLLWTTGSSTVSTSPGTTIESTSTTAFAVQDTTSPAYRLVLTAGENTARYLVREQLAGFDFPNDAVGETDAVTGEIIFTGSGDIISDMSGVTVDITGIESDSGMRDGYIQRNTLEGESYPTVQLVPLQTRGLTFPLPESGELTFDIVGNLTIKENTQPTSWRVNAEFENGTITGTARTEFTFEEFGMEKPSVGRVMSVSDAVRLEIDFTASVETLPAE